MKRFFSWLSDSADRQLGWLLFLLCLVVFLPYAGNYGMWDPWETHYGEVARQMAERNDWVSLWWPGSPQDRAEFWSKPVLTFWLIALSFKLFGLEWTHAADQMAASWRPEWAARFPMIVLSIMSIMAVYEAVMRTVGRRAAFLAGLVLLTSSQWMLITRQAMTDMPFVAPMTIALCLAAVALLSNDPRMTEELPRSKRGVPGHRFWNGFAYYVLLGVLFVLGNLGAKLRRHLGERMAQSKQRSRDLTGWPLAKSYRVLFIFMLLTVGLPIVVMSIQTRWTLRLGDMVVKLFPITPYLFLFAFALWASTRARTRRDIYMLLAYVLCGHATLAKGPAGVGLPAMVIGFFLILEGRWKDIVTHLHIPVGFVLFAVTAVPWYHAMLVRHYMGFWNEFFGDNYYNRAGGRHGDRGTFEYYIQYIAYGMFPWSGLVVAGAVKAAAKLREAAPGKGSVRHGLVLFALVWFVIDFGTVTIVNTKFHHYILPALPALAILAGLYLDELLDQPKKIDLLMIFLLAAPLTLLAGYDLGAFPPRVGWMFNYDYVNMPGTGRPWPTIASYGQRYEYGIWIYAHAVLAALATIAVGLVAWRRLKADSGSASDSASASDSDSAAASVWRASAGQLQTLTLVGLAAIAIGIACGPAGPDGMAPTIWEWGHLWPTLCMLALFAAVVYGLRKEKAWQPSYLGIAALFAVSLVWAGFVLDKYLIDLSPHWAQKHVIAAYYKNRGSADEPLIAWNLYWRGENFYTRNDIYRSDDPNQRTVFLQERAAEKLQAYVSTHRGRRMFFILERQKLEGLRALLPAESRSSLKVIDESNNKLYLAVADL